MRSTGGSRRNREARGWTRTPPWRGGGNLTLYAQWLKTDALAIGTAADDDSLAFTTGGSASWFGQTSDSHDGVDAVRSGQIGNRQSTWMETTVTGPATLSFWWKTSCEDVRHSWSWDFKEEFVTYVDAVTFTIDGKTMAQLAGRGEWEQKSFELEAGEHKLRWQFEKDSSNCEGLDCAWVDQIAWRYPHQVAFDANGGSCTASTQTVMHGTAIGELPTATRSGYMFLGWHTDKTGGGEITKDTAITKSQTLYAQWAKPTYQVGFDANGGTGTMAVQGMTYGKAEKLRANAFTRKGYTFAGWATAKAGKVAYKDGASVKNLRADGKTTILYAQWTPLTYKIAFKANGGKGTMAAQKLQYGKAAKLRANAFTRKGYTFAGWAKTKKGAVAYKNGASVKNLRADSGTTTFYARWAKSAYKVVFRANGGSGTMAAQKMTYGKAAKLRKNAFRRKGYLFLGWAKTKNGAVVFKNGAKVKNLRMDGKTTALHAKWAKKTYKVAFRANGGSGTMAVQKMTYGKAAKLRANAFRRTGYTFAGWATTATGAVAYKNAVAVKNLRSDGKTATLHAQWTPTTYTVAFAANGGSGAMAAQGMTYGKAAKLRANAFRRTGYTFAGWATTAAGAVAYLDAASVQNLRADGKTTTLHAVWTPTSYQVAFLPNGGEGSMAAQSFQYDKAAKLLANAFTRAGYAFAGWAKTATGAVAYGDQAEVKNLRSDGGTVTLHALWEKEEAPEDLPEAGSDAEVAEALGGAADGKLAEHIRTVADYAAFRTWALRVQGNDGEPAGTAAVMASEHAWVSYLLGSETLFENEPDIQLTGFAADGAPADGKSRKAEGTIMTIRLQVRDGSNMATVDADKVTALLKATGDLSDWTGEARLEPVVTPAGSDSDGTLVFLVDFGGESVSQAFFAIRE